MKIRFNLKNIRIQKKMTQKQIAQHLDIAEVSYQRIEAGTRGTSEDNWLKLYYLFDETVPLHKLMETR